MDIYVLKELGSWTSVIQSGFIVVDGEKMIVELYIHKVIDFVDLQSNLVCRSTK